MRRTGLIPRGLIFSLFIGLVAASQAAAHEGVHQRPLARGPIDPKESFQFLVLSGAGGHFHTLLLSPDLSTLFAGTHLGLFRSEDRGRSWRLAASRFSGEDVHALAWDPGSRSLYAATHRQGLLLSGDGGRRWSGHTHGLPGRDLHALTLDPRQPHVLYVWVKGHGLFRSDDGARRWRRVTGPEHLTGVESLAVHPDSDRLYAGTAKGVWVSEDRGHSWHRPNGGLPYRIAGVSVPSWRPDLLLAATLEGAFVGKADGTGWRQLPPQPSWWGLVTSFAFLAHRPEVIFAVTHEGVVAGRRFTGGEWVPAAELPDLDGNLSRK